MQDALYTPHHHAPAVQLLGQSLQCESDVHVKDQHHASFSTPIKTHSLHLQFANTLKEHLKRRRPRVSGKQQASIRLSNGIGRDVESTPKILLQLLLLALAGRKVQDGSSAMWQHI